jgi:DNA-binding NarL/FixJ family response regulator
VEAKIQKIRLLHIDCYAIMLDVVRGQIAGMNEEIVLTQSQNFELGLSQLKILSFDILMIGIAKEGDTRHEFHKHLMLLRSIRLTFPDLKIIVYSMGTSRNDVAHIIHAGADWFIDSSMGYQTLFEAIRASRGGVRHIGQQLWDMFKNSLQYLEGLADRLIPKSAVFSQRELEVLNLMASGYNSNQISETLFITPKTVETHRKNLIKKSKTRNTAELIYFSYQNGIL